MELPALHRLFYPLPDSWGLRGDPYLWLELEQVFAHLQLPGSAAEVDSLLHGLYCNLVGEAPVKGRQPFVKRYQGGGMSSGHVAADFWLERGFPLLKERILELLPAQTISVTQPASPDAQLRAALLGLAVGDALGVPVEFQSRAARDQDPVVSMRAYGTHHQPAGTWSDDASLTFCLAESIAQGFSLEKLAYTCCRWYYENLWTPHGRVFDIGITTREALQRIKTQPGLVRAGSTDEYSNGNGALMRILPLAFFREEASLQERFQLLVDVSAVTHGHIRSAVACFLYLEMARYLRAGHSPTQAYTLLCQQAPAHLQTLNIAPEEVGHFKRILGGQLLNIPAIQLSSGGYVLHTLEAALWCLLHYYTYADTVLAAVNLGDDTDTTGAVTGGLAGIYYGEAAIPVEWLQVVARRADIEDLAARMMQAVRSATIPTTVLPAPRPLPNSYWATSAILACEYPGDQKTDVARAKLQALLAAGITDFFDLTEAGELKPYQSLLHQLATEQGIITYYHRFPIRDVHVPTPETLEAVLTGVAATVAAGRKAAVHCWGGIGRTGTVIGCYLVRHQQLTGTEALDHIAREWKGVAKSNRVAKSPETPAQCKLVEDFK